MRLNNISVISLLAACVFLIFIALKKNPGKTLIYSGIIATITPSLIFKQTAPLFDEVLLGVLAALILFKCLVNRRIRDLKFTEFKIETVTLFYLLINTCLSFSSAPSISQMRFILIFCTFILLLIILSQEFIKIEKLSLIAQLTSSLYLYMWIAYWIILVVLKIDWADQQSKSLAGSVYSAIVPLFGIYILAYSFVTDGSENIKKLFWINYPLTILASLLFDTRALLMAIVVLTFTLILYKRSLKFLFRILAVFVITMIVSNFVGNFALADSKNIHKGSITQLESIVQDVRLLDNAKPSDGDRSYQIKCITNLVLFGSTPFHAFFGYGQNSHKEIRYKCPDFAPSDPGAPIRPVGYAAFIYDFGLIGLFLIIIIYVKRSKQLLKGRGGIFLFMLLSFIMAWSLVTNFLDHTLVLMVIFLNYLNYFRMSSDIFSRVRGA